MRDYHQWIGKILNGWLLLYALLLAPGLLKGLYFYVISDFIMPAKHYLDIMSTIEIGSLWLIPTGLLMVAYLLSKPSKNSYLGG